MKALKLTPRQKEVFDTLTRIPGGVLYKHVKPTGLICYRLLDDKKNPVMNIRSGLVDELLDKEVLDRDGNNYVLKATTESKIDIKNLGLVKNAS
jgi:hypothetical protein